MALRERFLISIQTTASKKRGGQLIGRSAHFLPGRVGWAYLAEEGGIPQCYDCLLSRVSTTTHAAAVPEGGKEASASINGYLKADLQQLREHWLAQYPGDEHLFRDLGRHIGFGMDGDWAGTSK